MDSSFWVSMEHGEISFDDYVPGDEMVATSPVIVMEMLRGGNRDVVRQTVTELLMHMEVLDDPMPLQRFRDAARIYLQCRAAGVTPSSSDCLIAATSIWHDVPLLHRDADFDHIARITPLKLFSRS